jgi:hypothetical protein
MTNLNGLFLDMLPSAYGALRNWGLEANPALVLHGLAAGAISLVSIVAFFRLADGRDRACVLFVATFLVTPYALNYDLGPFAAALAILASKIVSERHQQTRTIVLSCAMMLPIIMMPLGALELTIAPIIILAVWIFTPSDSGFSFYGASPTKAWSPVSASN